MAITGLLIHALADEVESVEDRVAARPGVTTYGVHEEQYVVAVLEAPSDGLQAKVDALEEVEGVLKVYTTYLNIEDEMPTLSGGGES